MAMAPKRSVPARDVLADIRVGMTDEQLMIKYTLSDRGIQSLKKKLFTAGLLAQTEPDRNSSSTQDSVPTDTKVLARKIAEAVRAGWSDGEIARTFGLLTDKLPHVFPLLIKHGYLSQEDYDERQARLEEAIDIKLDLGPATENLDPKVDAAPFVVIRGRTLLASLLLTAIATLVPSCIVWAVWGIKLESPLGIALSMVFSQIFVLLCVIYLLYLTKLSPGALLGPKPAWPLLRRSMLVAFPLMAMSIVGNYVLYLPLSYLIPKFVDWCLFCRPPMIIPSADYADISANILNFLVIVLIGPVVEEFFFRGLLLTRWSLKWNVRRAMIGSSLVFALLHPDNFVGAFLIGYVMSIFYISTKSLFIPIGVHMANNGIAWIVAGADMFLGDPYPANSLAQWQSFWWVALFLALMVVPWAIWFTKQHVPGTDWRIPYLALQEGS